MTGKGIEHTALDDFAGLGRRNPWLAAGLTVFLLSLAGFPPTAGFLAKFYVFGAAVGKGTSSWSSPPSSPASCPSRIT